VLDNSTSDIIIYLVLQINSCILHGNIGTKNEYERSKHKPTKPDIWQNYSGTRELAKDLRGPACAMGAEIWSLGRIISPHGILAKDLRGPACASPDGGRTFVPDIWSHGRIIHPLEFMLRTRVCKPHTKGWIFHPSAGLFALPPRTTTATFWEGV
jgi:hypothetical protein